MVSAPLKFRTPVPCYFGARYVFTFKIRSAVPKNLVAPYRNFGVPCRSFYSCKWGFKIQEKKRCYHVTKRNRWTKKVCPKITRHWCPKFYSQPRSRVNSISKSEMNIRISLYNVRRVNGMLDISLEIVPKKTH